MPSSPEQKAHGYHLSLVQRTLSSKPCPDHTPQLQIQTADWQESKEAISIPALTASLIELSCPDELADWLAQKTTPEQLAKEFGMTDLAFAFYSSSNLDDLMSNNGQSRLLTQQTMLAESLKAENQQVDLANLLIQFCTSAELEWLEGLLNARQAAVDELISNQVYLPINRYYPQIYDRCFARFEQGRCVRLQELRSQLETVVGSLSESQDKGFFRTLLTKIDTNKIIQVCQSADISFGNEEQASSSEYGFNYDDTKNDIRFEQENSYSRRRRPKHTSATARHLYRSMQDRPHLLVDLYIDKNASRTRLNKQNPSYLSLKEVNHKAKDYSRRALRRLEQTYPGMEWRTVAIQAEGIWCAHMQKRLPKRLAISLNQMYPDLRQVLFPAVTTPSDLVLQPLFADGATNLKTLVAKLTKASPASCFYYFLDRGGQLVLFDETAWQQNGCRFFELLSSYQPKKPKGKKGRVTRKRTLVPNQPETVLGEARDKNTGRLVFRLSVRLPPAISDREYQLFTEPDSEEAARFLLAGEVVFAWWGKTRSESDVRLLLKELSSCVSTATSVTYPKPPKSTELYPKKRVSPDAIPTDLSSRRKLRLSRRQKNAKRERKLRRYYRKPLNIKTLGMPLFKKSPK